MAWNGWSPARPSLHSADGNGSRPLLTDIPLAHQQPSRSRAAGSPRDAPKVAFRRGTTGAHNCLGQPPGGLDCPSDGREVTSPDRTVRDPFGESVKQSRLTRHT